MSEQLHPGIHPDADSLSAFVEGVLPEHERIQCLAHLAECGRCREIVFLSQETPVVAAIPAPAFPRPWFRRMPLLAAAAAICVTLLGTWLYLRSWTGAPAPPHDLVTRAPEAPALRPTSPAGGAAARPAVRNTIPGAATRNQTQAKAEKPSPVQSAISEPSRPAPPPTAVESASSSSSSSSVAVTASRAEVAIVVETTPGISGTVTDPSGAAVPQATVQLRQLANNSTTDTRTDQAGQFKFAGLAPGQYEIQINAPGFRRTLQRVEVQPQQVAAVKSELQVGSVSETVEVAATASTIQSDSAQVSTVSGRRRAPAKPRPLPNLLPTETMVSRGKIILALDSSGGLWVSGNSGKSWKAVKSQWTGKVDQLEALPQLPHAGKARFQLTTDSGSTWLSRDGRRWYPARPQH